MTNKTNGNGTHLEPWGRVEEVSPTKAAMWLQANKSNRPARRSRVTKLAQLIRSGRFRLNGEAIKFGRSGRLLDGQHRLMAIVLADMPVKCFVIWDLDESVFPTLDRPTVRTVADALNEPNAKALAAALSMLVAYKRNGIDVNGWKRLEPDEALQMLPQFPALPESVVAGAGMPRALGISRTVAATAHYLFAEKDREAANNFIERLRTGEGLMSGDPILDLRAALMSRTASTTMREGYAFALILKTWAKVRAGVVRTGVAGVRQSQKVYLRLRGDAAEDFPTVAE